MVIIVSFTAIASFILPNYDMVAAVRLVRFMLMVLAAMFGFVGLTVGLMAMVGHLITLKSLGMPYSTPLAPLHIKDWKDTIIRMPLWKMNKRPEGSAPLQSVRQGNTRTKEEQE